MTDSRTLPGPAKVPRPAAFTAAAALALILAGSAAGCGSRPRPGAWIPLFNGSDLSGWTVQCQPRDRGQVFWKADQGTVLCDSMGRPDHDYVWLVSDREFGDFELTLEFQAFRDSPGNSGVQFRSRYDPAARGGWLDGPQVDLHPPPSQNWRTGLIYDETRGEQRWVSPSLPDWRIDATHAPARHVFRYADDPEGWNQLTLECRGTRVKTTVNGVVRTDWDGSGVLDNADHQSRQVGLQGHFALQLHSRDELRIRFRNLKVREFPPTRMGGVSGDL